MRAPRVNDYRAAGYDVIHRSLTAYLVVLLGRMHDGVNQRPLAKQNKASLPLVFRLLEDDTVRLLWRQKAMT